MLADSLQHSLRNVRLYGIVGGIETLLQARRQNKRADDDHSDQQPS